MDYVFSILGLIVLFPIFIVVAIMIKTEDRKGKIFYKQLRCGKDGKLFYMFKFRSMVTNAEDLKIQLLYLLVNYNLSQNKFLMNLYLVSYITILLHHNHLLYLNLLFCSI